MAPKTLFFVISIATIFTLDRLRYHYFRGFLPLIKVSLLLTLLQWSLWLLYYWMIYPFFVSPIRHLPGPKGGSIFMGHFFQSIQGPPGKNFQRWVDIPNDGVIRFLQLFNAERVIPTTPAALADVLVNRNYDFEKPRLLRKGISRILGEGLFLAEGEEHKRQRKAMMPAFNFRHTKNLYPIFWEKSRVMVEEISKYIDVHPSEVMEKGIDVNEWASRATLDIIGLAGMDGDFGSLQNESNPLNIVYRKLFKPSRIGRLIGILNTILPSYIVRNLPLQRNDDIKNSSDIIKRSCFDLIQQKKIAMEKGTTGTDILSVALNSGGFSDEDLVNQMMTFLAAGHETTASALTWAVYMLCKHPDIQVKLREEVQSRLGSCISGDTAIRSDLIDDSPYLHAFCQEVLRLYPPVTITVREAVVDTFIAGIPIPKGTTIFLAPWAINTSTALWGDDAQDFKPERWTKSAGGGSSSNFAFLTFLHGPRSCIGQRFAVAEFASLVAYWVGAFETRLADENQKVEAMGGLTLKPKDGLWVQVKKRHITG